MFWLQRQVLPWSHRKVNQVICGDAGTSVLLVHIRSARPLVSVPVYFSLCAYLCLSGFSKGLYTS